MGLSASNNVCHTMLVRMIIMCQLIYSRCEIEPINYVSAGENDKYAYPVNPLQLFLLICLS